VIYEGLPKVVVLGQNTLETIMKCVDQSFLLHIFMLKYCTSQE
jgi:hypothetical protein